MGIGDQGFELRVDRGYGRRLVVLDGENGVLLHVFVDVVDEVIFHDLVLLRLREAQLA